MNSQEVTNLPRCPECGGKVELLARAGRTREYRRGVKLEIPDDFALPTCVACGEEVMVPEVSGELDRLLGAVYLERQANQLRTCVYMLRDRHGVTQQQIEDALRVTRSYLSHLMSGNREASQTLMVLVEIFTLFPESFEYALEGVPFDKHMVGLFDVAPSREYRVSKGFRQTANYRHAGRYKSLAEPLRVGA